MCMKTKVPEPKPIVPMPTRDVAAEVGARQRLRLQGQKGIFGNIATSALGDSSYGQAAVDKKLATLGA